MILLVSTVSATKLIELSRDGTTEVLEENQRYYFFSDDLKYYSTVEKIYDKTIRLTIDTNRINLRINEMEKLDLDNDYIYDVSVKLIGITESNAKLVFTSLIEAYSNIRQDPIIEILEPEEIIEETGEETLEISEDYEKLTELFQTYAKYVVIGVVILIGLIVVISISSKTKKKSSKKVKKYISNLFFEEVKKQ